MLTLRVDDPDARHAAVRLRTDLAVDDPEFAREDGGWVLRLAPGRVARLEYELELVGHDGHVVVVCDPGNPHRAPGAFGDKSVLLLPGYRPPAWLDAPRVEGAFTDMRDGVRLWSPAGAPAGAALPLLVAHDGPEYDALASLTAYAAAMIACGALPAFRVALLAPGDRDERYSASAAYARTLCRDVLPGLPAAGRPVGMGASLGALAMLHAQRRFPDAFAALFLQSGSFFVPRYDRHEAGFFRYGRIVRFVRTVRRGAPFAPVPVPVPVTLTCGAEEENVHNNRAMATALAAQGYPAELHEVPDLHNYTGWRDAFDPFLTELLQGVWT